MITAKDCGYISQRVGEICSKLNGDSVGITVVVANDTAQNIMDTVFVVNKYPTSTASQQSIEVYIQE